MYSMRVCRTFHILSEAEKKSYETLTDAERGLILEAAMGAWNRVGTSRNPPLPTKPQF